jgi:hypothetical protein
MLRRPNCIVSHIAWAALLSVVAPSVLSAEERTGDHAVDDWRIQRIYVPADKPEEWPREKTQRYLSMPAEDFERHLEAVRNGNRANDSATPQLAAADYTAVLSGDCLVQGEARLQLELRGTAPSVAILEDSNLPISDPLWLEGKKPAIVGNDSKGRLGVVVQRSGLLGWSWSLRGQSVDAGGVRFELSLPASPATTLHLALPPDYTLESSAGLVVLEPSSGEDELWRIQLGGQNRTTIEVIKNDLKHREPPLVLAEVFTIYELSPKGAALSARIDFDVVDGPIRRLAVQADRDLQPIGAKMSGEKLAISQSSGDASRAGLWTIEFPQAIPIGKHSIEIAAVSPLVSDTSWRLPKITVRDARWINGRAILRLAAPLQLSDLTCEGCEPVKTARRDEAENTDQIEIQCLTDTSDINLLVTRPHSRPRVSTGTAITLGPSEVAAQCVANLSVEDGARYSLEADVPAQWIIDSLDSEPPGHVAGWTHEALPGRGGKLKLQLQTPLTSDQDLRLNVSARRRRALLSEKLGPTDLEPLKFIEAQSKLRLLSLKALEPYQLQLDGAESLHYIDAEHLIPADADLLPKRNNDVMFVHDETAQDLAVSLMLKSPRYEVQIHTKAVVGEQNLTETYRFSIVPAGREVTRFVARFSQPRQEPITWSIDGAAAGLTCRRLPENEQPTLSPGDTELWEIVLATPRSEPFELVAVREIPLKSEVPVALASLIGAESQLAEVEVESVGTSWPEIRATRRLKAFPPELQPSDKMKNILGRFHYSEEDTLAAQEPPLVVVTSSDPTAEKSAWIWQASLESRFYRGEAEHTFTTDIETEGRRQITFRLPAGAKLRGASLDDAPLDTSSQKDEEVQVRLPSDVRFVTVVFTWTDDNSKEGFLFSTRSPPWPICDVAILRRQWIVALAPENVVVEAEIAGEAVVDVPWSRRLFGMLSRQTPTLTTGDQVAHSQPHAIAHSSSSNQASAAQNRLDGKPAVSAQLISPWKLADINTAAATGWTVYHFDDSPEARAWIRIADRRRILFGTLAILFLTVALRWWLGCVSPSTDCAILAVATAVALMAPPAIVNFTAAIWVGIVAAQTGLSLCIARLIGEHPAPAKRTSWTTVVSGASLLLLLAAMSIERGARAEETDRSPAAIPAGIRHVLIPIDAKGQPAGGRYYLPQNFYDELLSAGAASQAKEPQYLIESARYTTADSLLANDVSSSNWRASFKIHSLVERGAVRLPLGADGASLVPDTIKLDGDSIAADRDIERGLIAVEIKGRGHHDLEIGLRAPTKHSAIDFPVPTVANAEVEFASRSRGSITADTLGARLDSQQSNGNRFRAMLGPTKRVLIQAAAPDSSEATPAVFESRELYRMRVAPGAVFVTARFQIHVREGQLRELHFLADQRLRPLYVRQAQDIKLKDTGNQLREIVITLRQPISDASTVDVPMLLEESASPIRMPELRLVGSRAAQRLWGIDADPALEVAASENSAKTPVNEFMEAWGDADWKPRICFGGESDNVSLSFQSQKFTSSAKFRLALFIGEESISMLARAVISTGGGPVLFEHVSIPPEMQVDEVEAADSNGSIPTHWERIANDRLAIQLERSQAGTHSLTIRGKTARRKGEEEPVPQIKVQQCEDQGWQAVVARTAKVLVSVLSPHGQDLRVGDSSEAAALLAVFRQEGLITGAERPGERQPVAVLDSPRGLHSVALQVTPNRPKVKTVQVTSLAHSGDSWKATVDLDLQITGGLVDVLRLTIPSEWAGPLDVEPGMPFSVTDSPGNQQRELTLSPETPLAGPTRLHIGGPLTLATGQRPAIPEVQLLGPFRPAQYILLPRQLDGQQLEWDRRGLVARGLPENISVSVADRTSYRSFQTFGSRYRATLRSADASAEKSRVLLEDVALRFSADGQCSGVASFDLEPAAATNCQINLPKEYTLLQVTLDGVAAQRTDLGENRFNIWLGDNKLPRRLQAVFTGTVALPRDVQTLAAPILTGLPAERTLWTISAPDSVGRLSLNSAEHQTNSEQKLMRLQAWIELAESPARLYLEESSEELRDWYAPWLARIVASRVELAAAEKAGNETNRTSLDDRIRALDQQQARLVERLQATVMVKQISDQTKSVADPADLWSLEPNAERQIAFAATSNLPELAISYPERRTNDFGWKLAVVLSVLGLAGFPLVRRRRLPEEVEVRAQSGFAPYLAGLCLAVVWLIWLTPVFIGLFVAAASVLGAAIRYRGGMPGKNAHIGTMAAI